MLLLQLLVDMCIFWSAMALHWFCFDLLLVKRSFGSMKGFIRLMIWKLNLWWIAQMFAAWRWIRLMRAHGCCVGSLKEILSPRSVAAWVLVWKFWLKVAESWKSLEVFLKYFNNTCFWSELGISREGVKYFVNNLYGSHVCIHRQVKWQQRIV